MRNRKLLISASTAVAVLAIAAIVVITSSSGKAGHQAAGSPTGIEKSCPARPESGTIPVKPPQDLQWKSIGALILPTSATAGPTRYQGDIWTCFAHSPMGAVIAAYDIPGSLLSPDWLAAAETELGPGQGQQAFISISESQTYQPLTPGQIAQPVGFQVASYTPDVATIQILADAGDGQYQEDTRTVIWIDGDWKLSMTPDGTTGPDPVPVTSADGFVLWGGGGNA